MKQGIVVVSHGTADYEVRLRTIEDFALSIGDRMEDADIVSAYTNGDVRRAIRESSGEKIQNVKAAILTMQQKGVSHLTVVTTDILESVEHKKIREEISGLAGCFKEVHIAKPLLASAKDSEITARAFHGAFSEIVGDDILIVVAENDKTVYDDPEYADMYIGEEMFNDPLGSLEECLRKHIPNSHVASISGKRKLYKIIKSIKDNEEKRVVLVPLEFIAGENIENKVSQDYAELAARLEQEGYEVDQHFKGLGEYDAFQRLYMRHLYEA